jgi:amidase
VRLVTHVKFRRTDRPQTCYSVVWPAERSGIIGFKPTRNLISSEGLIHASMRLDSVGLLTRNVNDAKQILLEILNQSAHHSPETKLKMIQDIEPSCSSLDLKDIRIGIPWHLAAFASLHEAKFEPFKRVLSILKSAGATFVHDVRITGAQEFEALSSSERTIILDTDMKIATNSYLSSLTTNPARIHNLQDLIAFTKSCPGEEYPSRNVQVFERADATDPLSETYLKMLARDDYFSGEGGIEGALGRHRCSVLIVPTLCVTLQTFAAKAGSPVMSVPMGAYPEGTVVEIVAKNGLVNIAPGIP